jgi:hypothetical protein
MTTAISQPTTLLQWKSKFFGDRAFVAALNQMSLIAALIGATWLLAAAHLAVVARPAFVAGAIAIAAFYIRRSPWQYLTVVLWFWTLSPFVRRIVDYYGGFQATNIVLLTPHLITLFMLKSILTSRGLSKRPETVSGMLLLLPAFYGLTVSLVKGDIFAGAVASIDWLIPLLFYFYLIDLAPHIDEVESHLCSFVSLNMLVVTLYGLYQYYYPPPWDLKWAADAHVFSLGTLQLRPVSVLGGTGICAVWIGTLILLSMHFRTWLSMSLLPLAILFLALTEVRMTAGAVALGLATAAFFGERHLRLSLLGVIIAVVIAFVAIAILDPKAVDLLVGRFSTVNNLQNDGSALAREELYRMAPALINDYPFGRGIGAIGKGSYIGGSGGMDNFDSGIIAPFVVFGWLGGMIYLFGSFIVVAQACLAAQKTRLPTVIMLAILALSNLATSLFAPLIGIQGVILWFSVGYASSMAIRVQTRMPTDKVKI